MQVIDTQSIVHRGVHSVHRPHPPEGGWTVDVDGDGFGRKPEKVSVPYRSLGIALVQIHSAGGRPCFMDVDQKRAQYVIHIYWPQPKQGELL